MVNSSPAPIELLKPLLVAKKLDGLIIPTADAHQSEYVSHADERRAWISGFTGSNGTALVLQEEAGVKGYLWTDGRYFTQAEKELNSSFWTLMKMATKGVPTLSEFLIQKNVDKETRRTKNKKQKLENNLRVGVDPKYFSVGQYQQLEEKFPGLVSCSDVVDEIVEFQEFAGQKEGDAQWIQFLSAAEAGQSVSDKISCVKNRVFKETEGVYVVTDLSQFVWLFNLRGHMFFTTSPFVFGYAIITKAETFVFCNFNTTLKGENHLVKEENLSTFEYAEFVPKLRELVKGLTDEEKVFVTKQCNFEVYSTIEKEIGSKERIQFLFSPVAELKAVKNEVEIKSMIDAHVEDAVALVQFLHWIETEINAGSDIDEVQAADKLLEFRQEGPNFDTISFDTISSYESNGAIIHYNPRNSPDLVKKIGKESLYLLDSGGQYFPGGTTDITRTMILSSKPNEDEPGFKEMSKMFSLVLEGHAQLAIAEFPEETQGFKLDIFARSPLWRHGKDFKHGTGHGVGAWNNVHESPPGISPVVYLPEVNKLKPGMILSNEPGYYEVGQYGIRIENLVLVKAIEGREGFCKFDTISLVPIDLKLVDKEYLSESSIKWLNEYHEICNKVVGNRLKELNKIEAMKWLAVNCRQI
eukprot:snap_masked-scaffold_6-processed-gene-0.18-mRNA-1 protein AED:0.04 eAED:0.08 QI:0/-1/0/1/-1/1/1/0/638